MFRRLFFRRMLLRRLLLIVILLVLGHFVLRARAQAVPGGGGGLSPDQLQALQDQAAQMQAIRDQVLQNVQNAGVDPQVFAQEIQQQMQDGTLDMATLQQQLVQKGYMSQQMSDQLTGNLNSLQKTVRTASLNAIQTRLNASDEEWAVLLPKIQKVLELMPDVTPANPLASNGRAGGGGLGLGGLGTGQAAPTTEVAKAFRTLQEVLKDPNASEDRIADKLATWRDLHKKAVAQLELAQNDLVGILTLRQEAILMGLGVL